MKRYWFVRHAESLAQIGKEFSIDSALSQRGILQAEQLKLAFDGIKFDVVYISPLKRARQTYEHSGIDCKKVIFDSRLIEDMPEGAYQTILPYEELPGYGEKDLHNAWDRNPIERARDFFADTVESPEYERILVISHSCFLNILFQRLFLRSLVLNKDFYMGMNNCGISSISVVVNKSPLITLLFWNDVSHVRKFLGYDPMKENN